MTHPATERLQDYALGVLTGEEAAALAAHLAECEECSARLRELEQLPAALAEIEPALPPPAAPLLQTRPRPSTLSKLLRIAAALVIGFAAGLLAARQSCGPLVLVLDDYAATAAPLPLSGQPVTCAVVDLVGFAKE